MTHSSRVFRVGTRPSKLAGIQAQDALTRLHAWWPAAAFELIRVSSPGDRDRQTDLRESPPDFFTRDLDEAVRRGDIDFAIHSAKDLPDPVADDLDWFWLPWRADPRDALVLRAGASANDLPPDAVIGVSSARRADYCRRRFPAARQRPIRGDIEARLRLLDDGEFDAIVLAGAALERLELLHRVTEWIPESQLTPPDGQGALAITYRIGDPRLNLLRSLFVRAVRFVGAGAGNVEHCTLGGRRALEEADVCLHDTLMDQRVLALLPPAAMRRDVGKRCGDHEAPQSEITRSIADEARRGRRVVRLKGGDPGVFGRLAEETDELDRLDLPYDVLPGVSSLVAATTGTGLLLTRRGVSRGFCVLTPRGAGGALEPLDAAARARLPIVCFMALKVADEVARGLLTEGLSPDTPAAVVCDAGGEQERVIRTTLAGLAAAAASAPAGAAGLLIVGDVCRYGRECRRGALRGLRVLLTCSEALMDRAAMAVTDFGGMPIRRPAIKLVARADAVETVRTVDRYDWVTLTSPSAVSCFVECARRAALDLRRVPRLMVCGAGTSDALRREGFTADAVTADSFGSDGMLETARRCLRRGDRVLRLRSEKAGTGLAEALQAFGATVTDCVLYDNQFIRYVSLPEFGAVFFASASAVESFMTQWSGDPLKRSVVLAIGQPTAAALRRAGRAPDVIGNPATVQGAIESLARHVVEREMNA